MKRLLSTLFLFTFMVSCDNQPQEEFKLESSSERLISNEEIEKIGSLHNKFLTEAFSIYDFSNLDRKQELYSSFSTIESNIDFNNGTKSSIESYNKSIECDLNCIKSFMNDDEAFQFIERVNELELDGQIQNLEDLNIIIEEIKIAAQINISNGKNLDVILLYLEVFKNSADFWFPEEFGGSGDGYKIVTKIKGNNSKSALEYTKEISKGGKVLAADATGAAGALIGGALFANADAVIAPPVFFGRVAFASAWSSGVAALM